MTFYLLHTATLRTDGTFKPPKSSLMETFKKSIVADHQVAPLTPKLKGSAGVEILAPTVCEVLRVS